MGICKLSKPEKKYNYKELQENSILKAKKRKITSEKKKKKVIFNVNNLEKNNELKKENFEKTQNSKTVEDYKFLKKSLKNNFLFTHLNKTEFEKIFENMFSAKIKKNDYIFKQKEKADCFFIIKSGEFCVEINNKPKKKLKKGQTFGELALLYNAPRSASIKALKSSEVYGIERKIFKKILQEINSKEKSQKLTIINNLKIFENLTENQKEILVRNMTSLFYKKKERIITKGEKANSFFVIKKGLISCFDENRFIRDLKEGDSFGEQALYKNGVRELSVEAREDTELLGISREKLCGIFGSGLGMILVKNLQNWSIENDKDFRKLTKLQIFKWIDNTVIMNKRDQDFFVYAKKGQPFLKLFIILEGEFVYGDKVFKKGSIFGKGFLIPFQENPVFEEDLILKNAEYSFISLSDFYKILGSHDLNYIFESNKLIFKDLEKMNNYSDEKEIKLEDLIYLETIGKGQFGDVFLVSNKKTKKIYALKTTSKTLIKQKNLQNHIKNEKKVLTSINFPLITKLHKTFQDSHAIYFLLKFILGIDMFDYIRELDLLTNKESKYYIGSILSALHHLHSKDIIYRDLKPENIMINTKGILNLIDFGASKMMSKTRNRTFSIIGTPHYMAPEFLKGKGYTYLVDLWALGVCMFEFQCGYLPFGENEEDPFEIYKCVLGQNYEFPYYFLDKEFMEARDLINIFLSRTPERRLNGSYEGLKSHKFFEDLDWDNLVVGKLEPPCFPPNDLEINEEKIGKLFDKGVCVRDFVRDCYGNKKINGEDKRDLCGWELEFEEI